MSDTLSGALTLFFAACVVGLIVVTLAPQRFLGRLVAWWGALAAVPLGWVGIVALFGSAPATSWTLWTIPSVATITLSVDRLAGLFLAITAAVYIPTSLVVMTRLPHLPPQRSMRAFGVSYLGLLAAIALVLLAADIFSFLVAWELMSLLCYVLVQQGEPRSAAGYQLLILSEAGTVAIALGLITLANTAGSSSFAALRASASTLGSAARWGVFLLTFFGFGVKAGVMPVNTWIPEAYTVAPRAFIPVLAGATLNLGLYGILRVNADLLPTTSIGPGLVALIAGALTAIVGILYASTENDLKTMLAHSSIENAGIIIAGLGAGFLFRAAGAPALAGIAFIAALYHIVNHSAYKTLLYIGAGTVEEETGSRDLNRLGGLIRRLPWTALGFLAGALAIAALPPFNGFVSEWLTLQTMLASAALGSTAVKVVFALCGALLALTAALAMTTFVKAFAMGFLGMSRSPEADAAAPAPTITRWVMVLLGASCLALGVLATYVIPVLDGAILPITHFDTSLAIVPPFFSGSPTHAHLPAPFVHDFHAIGAQVGQRLLRGNGLVIMHRGGVPNPVVYAAAPFWIAVVFALLLLITWLAVRSLTRRRQLTRAHCWDGGLRRLLPEMTYTATGFSNPIRVVFDALFRPTTAEGTRDTVAQHFRTAIRRERGEVHLLERSVLHPTRSAAHAVATVLARLHHGRLNAYFGYALLTLLGTLLLAAWLR